MRSLCLLLLLSTSSGCRNDDGQLQTLQTELDARLQADMQRANNLNEARKEVEALELQVKAGVEEVPGAREAVAHLDAEPVDPTPPRVPLPQVPPKAVFESAHGAALRTRIEGAEERIAQLQRVLEEFDRLQTQRERMKKQLDLIEGTRAQKP